MTLTVPERKAKEVMRLRAAASVAMEQLGGYAASRGGRFAIFGSFAKGEVVYDSDFDVMVDFPPLVESEAQREAEAICRNLGLVPDIHLMSESSAALKGRIGRDAIVLP